MVAEIGGLFQLFRMFQGLPVGKLGPRGIFDRPFPVDGAIYPKTWNIRNSCQWNTRRSWTPSRPQV